MKISRPLIVANWKMHGLCETSRELITQIVLNKADLDNIVICPPFTLLYQVGQAIHGTMINLGGQDCHHEKQGAFTGDVSAAMLKDDGCSYVILGHSERRKNHHETDSLVQKKADAAHRAGLITIICVGESEKARERGDTLKVVEDQILHCLPKGTGPENAIIAYEPVWAIGSGKTPTSKEIGEVHEFIGALLKKKYPNFKKSSRIIYGGSVTPDNAEKILAIKGVGGLLVGGASLDAKSFSKIVKATRE